MAVAIDPSMNADAIQALIDSNPAGTVFNFAAGTYVLNHYLTLKDSQQVIGASQRRSILTGNDTAKGAICGAFGTTNQVIRGIIVEHFTNDSSFPNSGLQVRDGGLIDDCEVRYCNQGIAVNANNTVRACFVHDNRQYGIQGGPGNNILIENTEVSWNNTDHNDPGNDAGGSKIVGSTTGSDGVTWRNCYVHHNYGQGIWSDGNVINAVYEYNRCEYNGGAGISHEISWAAIIRYNTFRQNNTLTKPTSVWSGGAIELNNSQNVELYGNTIYAANRNGFAFVNSTRSEPVQFPQFLSNINAHDNDIYIRGAGFTGFAGDSAPSGVTFTNNHYHTDAGASWQNMAGVRTFAQWQAGGFDTAGNNVPWSTKGLLPGTGHSGRLDVLTPVRGAIPAPVISTSLPAWMFSGGVLQPKYKIFPIGVAGTASDTNLWNAYTRNPSAGWDPQDMDIGTCQNIGGLAPGRKGTRVGDWIGMSCAYSGAAVRYNGSWYMAYGGGDSFGFGNRVPYIKLEADQPVWALMSRGTEVKDIQGTPNCITCSPYPGPCAGPGGAAITKFSQQFLDDRNLGGQSGYSNQYFQNLDKFIVSVVLGPPDDASGGFFGSGRIRVFDWSAAGVAGGGAASSTVGWNAPSSQFPAANDSGQYGRICCYASRGGVDYYYFSQSGKMVFWNYPNATATILGSLGGLTAPWYVGMAYDSKRDQLVVLDGRSGSWTMYRWSCVTGVLTTTVLSTSVPVYTNISPNSSLEYDAAGDRFFYSLGYRWDQWSILDPKPVGGYTLTALSVQTPPTADPLGLIAFNRLRIVPNLGVIVGTNDLQVPRDAQLYAMRITDL